MTMETLERLARVYNTLLLVNTKGEDTIIMGDCLRELKNVLVAEQENMKAPKATEEE